MTTSEIAVDFAGDGAGTAPLTWGQLRVWQKAREIGQTMNIVVADLLPEGTSIAEMVAFLRFMVSRHPALRTQLRFVDGHPWQVVSGSGSVPLQIVDIDAGDPAATAEELRARYQLTWFDYEHEFPVRMGLVRQGGALRAIALGFSHVATDGAGLQVLTRDTERLDRTTLTATAAPAGLDPLELAAAQAGLAGRRQTARCVRHWTEQFARLRPWRNNTPADPQEPQFRELVVYSPALAVGLRAIQGRTGIGATPTLLAVYCVAVARVLGRNPAVAQIVVGNRFRPGFADTVLALSQPGLCVVDAAADTFDEVVARADQAVTAASFYGYYDPVELARIDTPPDISWHLNDRRALFATAGDDSPATEAELREALPRTKMYWDHAEPTFNGDLFLQVDSRPDPAMAKRVALDEGLPAVWLEIWANTHHFAQDQIEAFARELDAVVAAAAFDGKAPTGVG